MMRVLQTEKTKKLMLGNAIKTCSYYQCLFQAGRTYQLEKHKSRFGLDCLGLPNVES